MGRRNSVHMNNNVALPRGRPPVRVDLTQEDRAELNHAVRRGTTQHRVVMRAKAVLAASEGLATEKIAGDLRTSSDFVSKWRGHLPASVWEDCWTGPDPDIL